MSKNLSLESSWSDIGRTLTPSQPKFEQSSFFESPKVPMTIKPDPAPYSKDLPHVVNYTLGIPSVQIINNFYKELYNKYQSGVGANTAQKKYKRNSSYCPLFANQLQVLMPPKVPNDINYFKITQETKAHRSSLPIYGLRQEIVDSIRYFKCTIIKGDVGSGKSTQVPQMILEEGVRGSRPTRILSSQPFRISCIAPATRIAFERGENVGENVGFQSRLDSSFPFVSGSLLFSTHDLVLRSPPSAFAHFTHVILDEVQVLNYEMSYLLFTLLQLSAKYEFKLIILGGSFHLESMLSFVRNYIPLTNYIIVKSETVSKDILPVGDCLDYGKVLSLLSLIVRTTDADETILIVLGNFSQLCIFKHLIFNGELLCGSSFTLVLHHEDTPGMDFATLYERAPNRKIILSTGLINTLAPKDIKHVIDCAQEEKRELINGVVHYYKTSPPLDVVIERGPSYTFFKHNFKIIKENGSDFLSLKRLYLIASYSFKEPKINLFKFFSSLYCPPQKETLEAIHKELINIGALTENEVLTPLGRALLDFPVEPRLAKALIYSVIFKCLDPILTLVATQSYRDPFMEVNSPHEHETLLRKKKKLVENNYSDHLIIIRAYQEWEMAENKEAYNELLESCLLSPGSFEKISAIRTDLIGQLRASGFIKFKEGDGSIKELNDFSSSWPVVRAVLVASLFPNILHIGKNGYMESFHATDVIFAPTSCLSDERELPSQLVVYDELVSMGRFTVAKNCSLVSPLSLLLLAPTSSLLFQSQLKSLKAGSFSDWLKINVTYKDTSILTSKHLIHLHFRINHIIQRLITTPGSDLDEKEQLCFQTVVMALVSEDSNLKLGDVTGIGNWPRFAGGSLLAAPKHGFQKKSTEKNFGNDDLDLDDLLNREFGINNFYDKIY